ncbi:MAG: hypothetical protein HY465_04395, partial [Deltaproteobacteria bacterium]|nr:hypothetical protein [Deltaproteobacteria bacterium]
RAVLTIVTSEQTLLTDLEGATTILEVPALELHFKTSIGDRSVADGESYPIRGITTTTSDLAVPLFLRVPDTAPSVMRVTAIAIGGDDAEHFQWLNTAEEIARVHCSIDASSHLQPVDLSPPGFDMAPGASTIETMPFFGCVNFHRGDDQGKKIYTADLTVTAQELDPVGNPARNPDGSVKTSNLSIRLLAALNPLVGKYVLRVTQTMSTLLNPQFPSVASVASHQEMAAEIEAGRAKESDIQIFTAALILDPFDEETITDASGEHIMSTPSDGMTAVFRALDTHPISNAFEDQFLYDYANLVFDGSRPEGERGVFEDYPNVPETAKANGWRIFTTILSYPGPLAPLEQRPLQPSYCEIVNPCSQDGFKQFTPAGVEASGSKGACAFFYASAGRYDSLAFHTPTEMPGGVHTNLCNVADQPQQLTDANMGRYTVDGNITVEEIGLRFFGPTFVHNPFGPIGNVPPLDVVFHLAFTSGTLKPQGSPSDPNVLPDERIDTGEQMYKINLDDPAHANPAICSGNTDNRHFGGKVASSWRYLAPLLSKDEDGKIPAGCPEDGNDFDGGTAFLHGRPIDPDTRVATFVAASNFGSSDDLTFAFKDVMVFTAINGWLCDPNGDPEQFEGARCFDASFNERDAIGQISAVEEE